MNLEKIVENFLRESKEFVKNKTINNIFIYQNLVKVFQFYIVNFNGQQNYIKLNDFYFIAILNVDNQTMPELRELYKTVNEFINGVKKGTN